VSRTMTKTVPLSPAALLDGPKSRPELGVTRYAIVLAEKEGLIVRAGGKAGSGYTWKLTPKGRRRAKK
jgi:hypothetical protein